MTLKQIKQKQLGLNELLQLHLDDLENTITTMMGNHPEENTKSSDGAELSGGLLYDIHSAQKSLERKIDKLCNLKQRLQNSIYEPIETCVKA